MNLTRLGWWCNIICLLLAADGCSKASSVAHPLSGELNTRTRQQQGVTINRYPYSETDPEWLKQAWQRFIANDTYRIPDPGDSHIPEAAVIDKYHKIDIENAVRKPYLRGDFNHDGNKPDLVVIVEDSSRNDAPRFGIVIFNAPQDTQSLPTPHWLFRDRDLETTVISQWSGGITLVNYRKDGQSDGCFIEWDRQREKYYCKEGIPQTER